MGNHRIVFVLVPVIILALCNAESHSARLTAFGKTPNNQQQNNANKKNTLGRTRECKEETDCIAIQNTTCTSDPRDGKMRCLCRDSSAPMNGACPNLPRAVSSNCNTDSQCVEHAECKAAPNSTSTTRICLCREGFSEYDGWCSLGQQSTIPLSLLAILAIPLLVIMEGNRL